MTDWVRLWHDMPTDPKWRVIARKSGQPLPCVVSVFTLMLTNASGNSADRGVLLGWDHEDAGAALDMDAEAVEAIYEAMQGKVLDGDRLTGWERRQPKREDNTAAERKAAWKARKGSERNAQEQAGTLGNAVERTREDTETETDTPLSKDNGAAVETTQASDTAFWTGAKAYISDESKNPGALIGKWSRDNGKALTAQAITRAQLERPVQKIPFIEGCFRQLKQTASAQPVVPL
jgi:hypothetical protein